ncbi:MAG TPA: hypothetical protein VF192_01090 [Longimicrobiales bacterium]
MTAKKTPDLGEESWLEEHRREGLRPVPYDPARTAGFNRAVRIRQLGLVDGASEERYQAERSRRGL